MGSLRRHEGYLLIDHSNSPGVPDDLLRASGLPGMIEGQGAPVKFEAPTITCSHCEQVLVVNPNRTRARGYCTGCDHYICDVCTYAREVRREACAHIARLTEAIQEAGLKAAAPTSTLWLPPDFDQPLTHEPVVSERPAALAASVAATE